MNGNTEPRQPPHLVPGSRRGKPGRPRKGDTGIFHKSEHGHNVGTAISKRLVGSTDAEGSVVPQTVAPVQARLLDLHGAATYLGLSAWTIRDLEAAKILPRIRIPLPNHLELRKVLFDRVDLDRLIDSWKDSA